MEKIIDLRSDTVTRPTPGMREAISRAEVGDDLFGEDPSVNALQEKVAAILEKEGSIFAPSGTMSNLLAIRAQTHHGEEAILEEGSHPYNYEGGGSAAVSGVQFRCLKGERGILRVDQIMEAIRPADHHYPPTRLICLENTHNRGGGSIYPLDEIERIREMALEKGLTMHLDGARLFNACVATGISPAEYAKHFDSVSVCFSKGLGAPVGSVLAGSRELIDKVHRYRKMFGGGMRQAGVLAAAGIYALDHHFDRLRQDHDHAMILARSLEGLPGIKIHAKDVETNIIIFDLIEPAPEAEEVVTLLSEKGVSVLAIGKRRIRAVTHLDISGEDIERTKETFEDLFCTFK